MRVTITLHCLGPKNLEWTHFLMILSSTVETWQWPRISNSSIWTTTIRACLWVETTSNWAIWVWLSRRKTPWWRLSIIRISLTRCLPTTQISQRRLTHHAISTLKMQCYRRPKIRRRTRERSCITSLSISTSILSNRILKRMSSLDSRINRR